jgi:hypothetical protein
MLGHHRVHYTRLVLTKITRERDSAEKAGAGALARRSRTGGIEKGPAAGECYNSEIRACCGLHHRTCEASAYVRSEPHP